MNVSDFVNWGTVGVLTASGRGAVAVLEYRGDMTRLQKSETERGHSLFEARSGYSLPELPVNRVLLGNWGAEELIVCRTADDRLEIHCHGGPAAIERILQDLQQLGVSRMDWSTAAADLSVEQFCQLPPESRQTWLQDRYTQALARAQTRQVAQRIWLQQQRGLSFWLQLAEQISHPQNTSAASSQFAIQIQQALQWSEFGRHLCEPWHVVIGGRPNVGKSSLINALLGYQRAIVYDQPGTTRDVLTAHTAFAGWPVHLSDTAGQRAQAEPIEAAGVELARQALEAADLPILLFDGSQPPESADTELIEQFPQALRVLNKSDLPLVDGWRSNCFPDCEVSSHTGAGLAELQTHIVQRIVPNLPDDSLILPLFPLQIEILHACQAVISR